MAEDTKKMGATPKRDSNDELQCFKKILEYSVKFNKYLCNKYKQGKITFSSDILTFSTEFLKSIEDGTIKDKYENEWQESGQGYKDHGIQNFMEEYLKFTNGENTFKCFNRDKPQKICINKAAYNKDCDAYLNLASIPPVDKESVGTDINPVLKPDDNNPETKYFWGLEIGPGKDSTYVFPRLEYSIEDLGLGIEYDKLTELQKYNLQTFYNYFIEIRKQELMGSLTYRGMNQLLATHNMILTGAPGTGKTWSAKNIASWIICGMPYEKLTKKELKETYKKENEDFENRCKVVQFHPSYDYTDFVEGFRPTTENKTENNTNNTDNKISAPKATQVGFERVDGVFKQFCKEAVNEWDECQLKIKELLNGRCIKKEDIDKLTDAIIKNADDFTLNEDIFPKTSFCQEDSEGLNNRKKVVEKATKKHAKKYVFIIDEINRGELSKIFGELFYSIDPGYRGEDGKVDTQYQNMITDDKDEFKSGFYVPENVYVIGTMNDIDRSVESMDFAMRRRFSFIEVKANERMDMWTEDWKDLAMACMEAINKKIEDLPGLSSAYHIGPAYFKKLNNYMEQQGDDYPDFFKLWDNHLYGVIFEYLRGKKDAEKTIIEIQDIYLKALVEAINRRFNYGGMWGKMLLGQWKKASILDSSITGTGQDETEKSIKDYLVRVSDSIKVISLVDIYKKEIETIKEEDKAKLQIELSNHIHKLSIRIKYLMRIGHTIEGLHAR